MQHVIEQFESQIAALQAENELLNETRHHQEKTTQDLESQNRQLQQENQELESQNRQLQQENQELQQRNHQLQEDNQELQQQLSNVVVLAVPDYLGVRDRILKNWRVAKSPEKRERIGEALNRYIEAIKRE